MHPAFLRRVLTPRPFVCADYEQGPILSHPGQRCRRADSLRSPLLPAGHGAFAITPASCELLRGSEAGPTPSQTHYIIRAVPEAVNQRSYDIGWTPLHYAAAQAQYPGFLEIYEYLLASPLLPCHHARKTPPY